MSKDKNTEKFLNAVRDGDERAKLAQQMLAEIEAGGGIEELKAELVKSGHAGVDLEALKAAKTPEERLRAIMAMFGDRN